MKNICHNYHPFEYAIVKGGATMEQNSKRPLVLAQIEYFLRSMSEKNLRRVLWYISKIS